MDCDARVFHGAARVAPGEARVLLRAGAFVPGQNMEYAKGEASSEE